MENSDGNPIVWVFMGMEQIVMLKLQQCGVGRQDAGQGGISSSRNSQGILLSFSVTLRKTEMNFYPGYRRNPPASML